MVLHFFVIKCKSHFLFIIIKINKHITLSNITITLYRLIKTLTVFYEYINYFVFYRINNVF